MTNNSDSNNDYSTNTNINNEEQQEENIVVEGAAATTMRAQPVESTEPRETPRRRRRRSSATPQAPVLPEPTETTNDIVSEDEAEKTIKASLDNLITNYEQAAEYKANGVTTEEIIRAGERELRARNRLLARRRGRGRF